MTTENNKIIAEFIGWNVVKEQDFLEGNYDENLLNDKLMIDRQLKYNSDWNQLMEVIEKIGGFKYSKELFKQQSKVCALPIYIPINEVYNACIEFIKWYNEQNN